MVKVGKKIRELRENNNMLLRELAAIINVDIALLSKIERGERIATKKQIILIAKHFGIDQNEFLSRWLGEKIAYEIKDEDIASDALKIAEQEIEYYNNTRNEVRYV